MKYASIALLLFAGLLIPVKGTYAAHQNTKVTICHLPNSANQTLSIAYTALDEHLSHGDKVGVCETPNVPEFGIIPGAIALISSTGIFYGLKKKYN